MQDQARSPEAVIVSLGCWIAALPFGTERPFRLKLTDSRIGEKLIAGSAAIFLAAC